MLSSSVTVFADEVIKVYVDGEQLDFDVNPIIESERTLVPMRAIFEALGAEVTWDQDTRTASAVKGDDTVEITIDSNTLYKNGTAVELDVPAQIIGERTLVPVRAISESFDADVLWDGETQSVIITNAEPTKSPESTPTPKSTPAPTNQDRIQFTETDTNTLNSKKELIRYDFEQSTLPQYIFENSDTIYGNLGSYEDLDSYAKFADIVFGVWDKTVAAYALEIAMESETTYEIPEDLSGDDAVVKYLAGAAESAGIDADTVFEGVTCLDGENGIKMGVVIFNDADSLVQCKYLGVIVSEKGEPRYFTAENDIMDSEHWYFCEVTKAGRGTIGMFDKKDEVEDIDAFAYSMTQTYGSN
ncbi:MAG: copper amine oxidase N-terminal domain-containing protein [Oscillospiraceae bacterium]|nr:copper amine oxidase N-terminal domain-containing protein [Oscillospiraceae bacterium]